jgi:hypothetical protein
MESLGCCFGLAGAQQKYAEGKIKVLHPTEGKKAHDRPGRLAVL